MSLWAFVCSVHLCKSVRNRTLPLYDTTHKQLAGEVFLSQSAQILQNPFAYCFEPTRWWPLPQPLPRREGRDYRDTPIGLLAWGVVRFFSHAGEFFLSQSAQSSLSNFAHSFESTEGLRHTENTERYRFHWGEVCERGELIRW